jgi:hypothetical protein
MASINECVKLGNVCLFLGDSLPAQTLNFVDDAGDPVSITTASVDVTVTKTDTTVAALAYDETDTTEIDRTSGTLTYEIGATAMATLSLGSYTIAGTVATAAFTRSFIQRLDIKAKSVVAT